MPPHSSSSISPGTRRTRNPALSGLLWLFVFLFALRVLGQALQLWRPQPCLPAFEAFQGSRLPYWVLLTAQLAILGLMVRFASRVRLGALTASRRAGKVLSWVGGAYMAGSVGRIAVGLAVPGAPVWFSTWIPAVFHLVLAGFVLTLAAYHWVGSSMEKRA